jgi:hypothetical protein
MKSEMRPTLKVVGQAVVHNYMKSEQIQCISIQWLTLHAQKR